MSDLLGLSFNNAEVPTKIEKKGSDLLTNAFAQFGVEFDEPIETRSRA